MGSCGTTLVPGAVVCILRIDEDVDTAAAAVLDFALSSRRHQAVFEAAAPAPRPLTPLETLRYAPFFDRAVIERVRVVDGRVPFWLRPAMCGVTLGERVYLRRGAYRSDSAEGIELLGHELVHVEQFQRGMTVPAYLWACRCGYRANRYEREARQRAALIRREVCGGL